MDIDDSRCLPASRFIAGKNKNALLADQQGVFQISTEY